MSGIDFAKENLIIMLECYCQCTKDEESISQARKTVLLSLTALDAYRAQFDAPKEET